jgi:PAS domain S-box-containing protein
MAAGDLAETTARAEEVVPRVFALVVPDLADRCLLHQYVDGAVQLTAGELERGARPAAPPATCDEPQLIDARDGDLRAAGVSSAVVVPLRVRGRTTGWLTFASTTSGRAYVGDDLRFLRVFTGRLAVALDNARLVLAERQLEALIEGMEDAVTVRDGEGRIVLANRAAVELLGAASLAELRETSLSELWERYALFDAGGRPVTDADLGWMQALQGRRRVPSTLIRRVTRATGLQQWLVMKATALGGQDGRPALVMNVIEDVSAQKRAELGQRLLVEAGRLLSETMELEPTLQQIAELTVPDLADWCGIDLPGPGGFLEQAAVAHLEPEKIALAYRLRASRPLHQDDEDVVPQVLRTGESVRMEVTPELIAAAGRDAEEMRLIEELGLAAVLAVPLRSGDAVLGVLTLIATQAHRRFDDADQEVAEALARRVGDALRNARLYEERAQLAHVLSAGLRPDDSPVIPGCEVAALYRPAGDDVEAGGDFYDVIDAPSGAIVVMGDVVGKGAPAAALSAVSRVTLRTAGRLTGDPHAALDELNHALRRRGGMSLCTAVAMALPPELPGTAQLLLAGHPPPLLVRDGEVIPLGQHGPMLGAVEVADWPVTEVELRPADVLVLYTDGVLDAVLPGGERFGEDRLRAVVRETGGEVDALVAEVHAQLHGLRLRDDVAMLAIRCPGPLPLLVRGTLDGNAEQLLELRLPGGATAPGAARRALVAAIGERLGETAQGDALIVISELVTNAIRHGGAQEESAEVRIDVALLPEALRLEVTDPGPGFEPGGHGPRADGGYGLHLLDRLAARWGVAGASPVTVWVELAR